MIRTVQGVLVRASQQAHACARLLLSCVGLLGYGIAQRNARLDDGCHVLSKPYRPQTSGKVKRFIQTCLREWAYARTWNNRAERSAWLPSFLAYCNVRRPHSASGDNLQLSRLRENRGRSTCTFGRALCAAPMGAMHLRSWLRALLLVLGLSLSWGAQADLSVKELGYLMYNGNPLPVNGSTRYTRAEGAQMVLATYFSNLAAGFAVEGTAWAKDIPSAGQVFFQVCETYAYAVDAYGNHVEEHCLPGPWSVPADQWGNQITVCGAACGVIYNYGWITLQACPANSTQGTQSSAQNCQCNLGYDKNSTNPNACSKLEEAWPGKEPCPYCKGGPIYPMTGVQKLPVRTGLALRGVELTLTYDSGLGQRPVSADNITMLIEPAAYGLLWHSSYHRKLAVSVTKKAALLSRGNGLVLSFTGDGAGNFSAYGFHNGRLVTIAGGYRYTDVSTGDIETYDSTGALISLAKAEGATLTFTYSYGQLVKVQGDDGRAVQFVYTNNLITKVIGPDGQAITVAYTNGNLTSLTWPNSTARSFVYESAGLPWALTGVIDENNARHATFGYDDSGHAISTEQAGGVNKFSSTYTSAPAWIVTDTYEAATDTIHRVHSWQLPAGIVVSTPNGQTETTGATMVYGAPSRTSSTQPAGSGSAVSAIGFANDSAGNVTSRNDADDTRTCFAYDAGRRETVRVEGLASTVDCATVTPTNATLPAGARRITTDWHPDWKLPTVITEPLKKTTIVYHGQPDPFNGNATANCTSAPNRADGKPVPLVCKQVEQALLPNGSVDATVPTRTTSYSYDSSARVLTEIDAKGHSTSRAYFNDTAFSGNYDPNFAKISLLVHAEGVDGSTTVNDSSPARRIFTASGGARLSTAQHKFGASSMYFGATGDRLVTAPSDDFRWGAGDFTVEAWIYLSGYSAYGQIAGMHRYGTDNLWLMDITSVGKLQYYNAVGTQQMSVAAIPLGSWHHVAVTRSAGVNRMFIDGVLDSTWTDTLNYAGYNYSLTIGDDYTGNANAQFKGNIDDLRITKGVARYTASFAPPAAAFPDVSVDMNAVGHTVGDLQSVTNAAGQVTQYTLYDPSGRVRQMIDPKGIVTDIAYTPRGWASTVTVTPPGGSARTTSYTYDGAGQMTGVSLPDGTSLAYSYDAAHRLTGVTDTLGDSVTYTLDAAGNRTGEDLRDATGALRRSIARSFDALNRLQQVTGAAQ